jgi:uncharacterized protein YjbJ (UPF0337 family)
MATENKIANAVDDVAGKAKEAVGRMSGDREIEDEGRRDQAKSKVKKAGENIKDAVHAVTKD